MKTKKDISKWKGIIRRTRRNGEEYEEEKENEELEMMMEKMACSRG